MAAPSSGTASADRSLRERLGYVVQAPLEVSALPGVQYTDPPGDPGLFGPGSLSWRVGSDWPSALVGGMSGLVLGTLHPQVLAGTLDHSTFRTDPIGRLARTASFVMATAFASTEVALAVADHVNGLHRRISGTAPNGRPYEATDPKLAVWTHVTIYGGFLEGHLRYAPVPIAGCEIDDYWDEIARVPALLGATEVPRSRADVDDYFREVKPELEASSDALASARWVLDGSVPTIRDTAHALVAAWRAEMPRSTTTALHRVLPPASLAAVRFAYWIFARAAVDLLPDWAASDLRLASSRWAEAATKAYFGSLRAVVPTVPKALLEARHRVGHGL